MSILAIDYGARRIGIAVSESGVLATPHSVIPNKGDVVDLLARLAAEVGAETIVLGLPARQYADPRERMLRDLAERLRQKTCKEVVLWDESLSTADAFDRVRETGRSRRDAQREIDMHAAAVILQSYLDEMARQRRPS